MIVQLEYALLAMAIPPSTSWMVIAGLLFGAYASSEAQDLQFSTFECSLHIRDVNWEMRCESKNSRTESRSSKFFVIELRGKFESTSPTLFEELLNSTSFSDSEFYQCDEMLRSIISSDRSIMTQNCENCSQCLEERTDVSNCRQYLEKLIDVLDPSFLTSVVISNASESGNILDILSDFPYLDDVRISDSHFPNMTKLPLYAHNSLRRLILTRDKIQSIGGEVFRNLPGLQTLDLSNNALEYLDKSFFGNLTMISTLDVSFNSIEAISKDAFSNLLSLRNLYIRNNNLKYIDENIFRENSLLNVIDISNNELKIIPEKIFNRLPGLRNFTCANCSLLSLDKDLFLHSTNIYYLDFSHNFIQGIPEDTFGNLRFLQELDLGHNNISNLNVNFLPNHAYLTYLNLASNKIAHLTSGVFSHAPNIRFLILNNNRLGMLTDIDLQNFTDMETINLRQNMIVRVELGLNGYVFVRKLLLADNLIVKFNVTWKNLKYMENFELDNNQLTTLDVPPCIPSVKQTVTFSFKYNKISRINMDFLLLDERKIEKVGMKMDGCFFNGFAKNFIDLTHNPLMCDCHLYPFYKYIKRNPPKKYQLDMFLNVDNLTCAAPELLNNKSLTSLIYDEFSCSFSKACPHSCTCGVRGNDNMILMNCSAKGLKDIPESAPQGTTVLYFNNNKLSSIESLNSKIWSNLTEIHFDSNLLTDLNGWNFPSSLVYLSVRGNKLKTLPESLMKFITNRTDFQLYFGGNDDNCTCDREYLKRFLVKSKTVVKDLEKVVCRVTNGGKSDFLPLISVPDNELCPTTSSQRTLIISLCTFFPLLIIILLFYYTQRQLILSFLYVYCDVLFHLCYSEDECTEDNFDAFVAYSSKDRDIVMEMLRELEDKPPHFNLCIHERNWLPGGFISDNIINSVQSSRRTIVVLSNSFIASPWFNLELRAAVFRMSKDKMSKIIVVLTDKSVSLSSIEPELRYVISKRTYLVWGERWFWEKLRYVMPRKKHVANRFERAKRTTSEMALVPTTV